MGRSVAYPSNAVWTLYFDIDDDDQDDEAYLDFDFIIECIQENIIELYPSFYKVDSWLDREEHVILENGLGKIVLCNYCHLCSLSFVPSDSHHDLAQHFADQIKESIQKLYGTLIPVGRASNGERFFERKEESASV